MIVGCGDAVAVECLGPFFAAHNVGCIVRRSSRRLLWRNNMRYGLSAYVWTNDLRTAIKSAERLEFGLVGINEWAPQSAEVPFPGWKESGLGRDSGAGGLEEYLETKVIAFGGLV